MSISRHIAFHDIAINGDKGWFFNIGYNAICEISISTGEVRVEAFVPDDDLNISEKYCGIAYYEGKLYLSPRNETKICIYDLTDRNFKFISLDTEKYGEELNYNLVHQIRVIDNYIFFFPGRLHAIVKLNPKDDSIDYIDNWYSSICDSWTKDKENLLIFNDILDDADGNIILPCWRSNRILKMNVFSQKYEVINCGLEGDISGLIKCGDSYLAAIKNSKKIYRVENAVTEELPVEVENDEFFFMYSDGKRFCTIPKLGDEIDVFELETLEKIYEYKICKDKDSLEWLNYENMSLCNKKIDEHRILFYENGKIIVLDMEKMTTDEIKINTTPETDFMIKEHFSEYAKKNLNYESVRFGLGDFMETLNE